MDALTLAEFSPERCPWPCKLGVVANIIIILAGIKAAVGYFRSRNASGSNK